MKIPHAVFNLTSVGDIIVVQRQDWECRGANCIELLKKILTETDLQSAGKTGIVSYGDEPPPQEWAAQFDLAFSTTKQVGQKSPSFPFPCPYTLRWPEVGIPDADSMMGQLLFDQSPVEANRIFWIGAETHSSRRILWELGQKHADLFDVELMQWDRKAAGGQRSKTRQVPLTAHRNYKYLIDCPGRGYSARLKWLLATGRPVFVVDRPYVEHWHEELEPWVHFIPVAANLSNLLDHHAKLEQDPDLYEAIGFQGRQFAATKLRVAHQLERTIRSIQIHAESSKSLQATFQPCKGKRTVMVIARYRENIAWIDSVSEEIDIFVINKGAPLDSAAFQRRDVHIVSRPNLGREADSYLSFMERGYHRFYERVIFTQGDPFCHSPDFLALLSQIDKWSDTQPLGCRWSVHKALPPPHLVATDKEHWLGDFRIRKELFSLFTLGTVRYHDRGIIRVLEDYQRFHGLPHGSNIAAHFFSTVSLLNLSRLAAKADLGMFTFSALFSVKSDAISRLPQRALIAMRQLCQQDRLHVYIMERFWLHLFGHPFLHSSVQANASDVQAHGTSEAAVV
jgi:hypothetical protein